MKFDKAQAIHYGIMIVVVAAGVLVATNWIQPMINSSKVTPPATA